MKRKKLSYQERTIKYIQSYNFFGFLVGTIFVLLSFLPSLLPRGWVLQGLLTGILFCIGYGIGVFVSLIVREFKPKEPSVAKKLKVKKVVAGLALLLYIVALALGAHWQQQVRQLVGQPVDNGFMIVSTTVMFVLTAMLIMLISRSIVSLYYLLKRLILRWIPRRLALTAAAVFTALIVIGLVNGVILNGFIAVANQGFSVKNGTTDDGITQPTAPELSGSSQSLIPWDSLGRQGRSFVSRGQKTDKISQFTHTNPVQPVRIYSGLKSDSSATSRAELAVKDLKRAGGFNRKVLVVATTTGTGWIDEQGVEGLEYMYNGNTAIVSMQYSYLPSWLSFLVDRSKAQEAGVELYNAVLGEWLKIPPANRPKLVIFGESLGSFGGESAFTGWSAFRATSSGSVWVGPPNFNSLWHPTTANRDAGTPEVLPVVDGGRTVRYAMKSQDISIVPLSNWQSPKAVYLQNSSDPIVWWSPNLLFHEPDWLKEQRGPDVSSATRWFPIITFWQVTGDMVFSTGVPDNHGHKYGTMPTEAWSRVAPPEGWTTQKTEQLRSFLSQ